MQGKKIKQHSVVDVSVNGILVFPLFSTRRFRGCRGMKRAQPNTVEVAVIL